MDIAAFHFLRPWWLVLIPLAVALLWLWQHQSNPTAKWGKLIAPHLLHALLVGEKSNFRIKPIHLVSGALILTSLAIAGPTWEKEQPPFSQDKAPMIIAIDLSRSMDATDISPTRLERVKQKVSDLAKLRPGARTGLVVYAGTAHMVVPPAEDPAIMQIFLDALATDLMPVAGKNAAAALAEAEKLLGKEDAPGTLLFFTDGFDTSQIPAFRAVAKQGAHQILVLAVGTAQGGPLRSPNGEVAVDSDGRPVTGSFDSNSLKQLSSEADIPLASLTLDDDDMNWVQRRAQTHMQQVEAKNNDLRWKESGYWLCIPIALLALVWFRRGWVVHWCLVPWWVAHWCVGFVFIASLTAPTPAQAATFSTQSLADLFLTPNQQGRWHFAHGDYLKAAEHFSDPLWKGLAYSKGGKYQEALGEFARLDSARGYFEMGNSYARLQHYPEAIKAFTLALKTQPEFPEADANRTLVKALLAQKKKKEDDSEEAPDVDPDEIKFDNKENKGQEKQVTEQQLRKQNADMWMRNLKTSPSDFLRMKFSLQAEASLPDLPPEHLPSEPQKEPQP